MWIRLLVSILSIICSKSISSQTIEREEWINYILHRLEYNEKLTGGHVDGILYDSISNESIGAWALTSYAINDSIFKYRYEHYQDSITYISDFYIVDYEICKVTEKGIYKKRKYEFFVQVRNSIIKEFVTLRHMDTSLINLRTKELEKNITKRQKIFFRRRNNISKL